MIIKKVRFTVGSVTLSLGVFGSWLHSGRRFAMEGRQPSRTAGIASAPLLTALLFEAGLNIIESGEVGISDLHFVLAAAPSGA
jgi:hypothetical protein